MSNKVMNTNDAPVAKFAEVFVTRNGKRNAMLMCKDFEGKANISTQDYCAIIGLNQKDLENQGILA